MKQDILELFEKYEGSRKTEDRNKIVERYMYLAKNISKKFTNRGVDYDDLLQIASLGLVKATERFDVSKGLSFVTFAMPTIIGEIKRYFRDKVPHLKIPRKLYELYQKILLIKEDLTYKLGHIPTVYEIADELGESVDDCIAALESSHGYRALSFDNNLFEEDTNLYELTGENDKGFSQMENNDMINRIYKVLSEKEKKLFDIRFVKGLSQVQTAKVMGVSQMTISRMEKKLIQKSKKIVAL